MPTRPQPSAHVIAATFGTDVADVRRARYQPTRYTAPAVYVLGGAYYACAQRKPAHDVGTWHRHPDQFFAERAGTVLWHTDEGNDT